MLVIITDIEQTAVHNRERQTLEKQEMRLPVKNTREKLDA